MEILTLHVCSKLTTNNYKREKADNAQKKIIEISNF